MRVKENLAGFTSRSAREYYTKTLGFKDEYLSSRMFKSFQMKESRSRAGYCCYPPWRRKAQNKGKFGKGRKWNSFKRDGMNRWVIETED